jgi:Periplasmic binding protein
MGIIDGGVAVGHFHMPPPFQRREHHEQIGDAIAFVFVIVTRLASRLRRDRRARLDDQLLRGFVEAHERTLRIMRPLIDLQHVFHVGDKGRAGVRRDHPLLLAMRFENVFLSVRPIVLSLARSTMCSSTTFSSSRRRLQRANPSGAGDGQRDQFCFCYAVENPRPASIPVLTFGPTGTIITQQFQPPEYRRNYIFRVSVNDAIQSEMIAAEAIDRAKFTRVAIFADTTNYGQLGRADLEAALARRGVTAVSVEKFNIGDVDMTAQILRAKDANAQALLTYGIGPELAQIANGMAKLNWKVPMIGSWTLSYANFIDNAGANGEGARMPQSFVEDASTPKRKAYLDAYNKAYGRNTMPSAGAQAY